MELVESVDVQLVEDVEEQQAEADKVQPVDEVDQQSL